MRNLLGISLIFAGSLMAAAASASPAAPTLDARLAALRVQAKVQLAKLAALPAVCVPKRDTDETVFRGCIDWHSSVHGTWALLAYAKLTGDHQYDAIAEGPMTTDGIAAERRKLAGQVYFEMPYGRAWFLRLAIAHGQKHGKTHLTDMADEMAKSLLDRYTQTGPRPFELEYANPAWAVINLIDYLDWRKALPADSDGGQRAIDARDNVRSVLRDARIAYRDLGVRGSSVTFVLSDRGRLEEAQRLLRSTVAANSGYDVVDEGLGRLTLHLRGRGEQLPDRAALTPFMRPFLNPTAKCSLADEAAHPQFMSVCGNWAALIAMWLPKDNAGMAIDNLVTDIGTAAPVTTAINAHHYGLNFSRAWSAWIVYSRTGDERWGKIFADHMEFMNAHPDWWSFDYGQVGHWVAQFGIFAWERFLTDKVSR